MEGGSQPSTDSDWTSLLAGRDESQYWTDLVQARASDSDGAARRLVGQLKTFPEALSDSRESAMPAVQALSGSVLEFVNSLELPESEVSLATLFWTNRINRALEAAGLRLRLRKIYPRDRFDHDTMESVASETGHHLTVARALTWTIVEMGDKSSRVIHRGKVVTS
jgi:hypothetical protein